MVPKFLLSRFGLFWAFKVLMWVAPAAHLFTVGYWYRPHTHIKQTLTHTTHTPHTHTHARTHTHTYTPFLKLLSDSPAILLMISGPLMRKKKAPVSLATALAMRVLPVPGGPYSKIPRGGFTPMARNSWGWRRGNSTIWNRCSGGEGRWRNAMFSSCRNPLPLGFLPSLKGLWKGSEAFCQIYYFQGCINFGEPFVTLWPPKASPFHLQKSPRGA